MNYEIEKKSPTEPVQDVKATETKIEVNQEPPQHASLASQLMRGDRVLWGIYFILIAISIVEMFSARRNSVVISRSEGNTEKSSASEL